MLRHDHLMHFNRAATQETPSYGSMYQLSAPMVRGALEAGQLLYRINSTSLEITSEVFMGFVPYMTLSGKPAYVGLVSDKFHNIVTRPYLTRDILLSVRKGYKTECIFVEECVAKTAQRHLKKQLIAKLEKE